jgi:hypothetical protein
MLGENIPRTLRIGGRLNLSVSLDGDHVPAGKLNMVIQLVVNHLTDCVIPPLGTVVYADGNTKQLSVLCCAMWCNFVLNDLSCIVVCCGCCVVWCVVWLLLWFVMFYDIVVCGDCHGLLCSMILCCVAIIMACPIVIVMVCCVVWYCVVGGAVLCFTLLYDSMLCVLLCHGLFCCMRICCAWHYIMVYSVVWYCFVCKIWRQHSVWMCRSNKETLMLCIWEVSDQISAWRPSILTENCRGFT